MAVKINRKSDKQKGEEYKQEEEEQQEDNRVVHRCPVWVDIRGEGTRCIGAVDARDQEEADRRAWKVVDERGIDRDKVKEMKCRP